MRRNSKRYDMINVLPLLELQGLMKLKTYEVAELIGVSNNQYFKYKRRGLMPLYRFHSFVNGIKLQVTEEAIRRLNIIDKTIAEADGECSR